MGSELGQSAAKAMDMRRLYPRTLSTHKQVSVNPSSMDMGRLYPRAMSTHKQVSVNPSEVQELHALEAR